MNNFFKRILICSLISLHSQLTYAESDYPAPDADVFAEITSMNSDYSNLGSDETGNGRRVLVGWELQNSSQSGYLYTMEVSFFNLGEAKEQLQNLRTGSAITNIERAQFSGSFIDGVTDIQSKEIISSGISIGSRISKPINHNLSWYVRPGVTFWGVKRKLSPTKIFDLNPDPDVVENSNSQTETKTGMSFNVNLGARYKLTKRISAHAEYGQYLLDGDIASSLMLGLGFDL